VFPPEPQPIPRASSEPEGRARAIGSPAQFGGLTWKELPHGHPDDDHELGLPWAPSQETVQRRVAEDAQPDGALRSLMRNNRVRKYAASVLAVAVLVALWGGYIRGWQWTGFPANNQLWNWFQLLLPLVVPTVLLPATVTWISGDAAQRAEEAREVPEQRSAVSHRAESRPAIPPRPPAGARTSLMLAGRSGPAIARRPTTGRGARPRRRAAAEDS
jgi:hypothetical protein